MNAFGKILAIIFAVAVIIFIPLTTLTQRHDSITQGVVYNEVVAFVEQIRKQGAITQGDYLNFMNALNNTGLLYEVELEHGHDSVVPMFDADNKVNGTKSVTDIMYTEQILATIYTKDTDIDNGESQGIYKMSKGDMFSVIVHNREPTLYQKLTSTVFGKSESEWVIYVTYGGVIRDETI